MLDPRRVLTFREVARRASFSDAARVLNLSQPAVSQQIKLLERQLGTRLLQRGAGGLRLTEAGSLLLAHADSLGERLELADRQLAELSSTERRRVRVGAFPSAIATLVPAAARSLRQETSELELHVVEGTTDELAAGVRAGALHVALCFQDAAAPPRRHPGTRRRELLTEPMLAAVATTHRAARRKQIRLEELADDVWTAASSSGLIRRACVAAGFEPLIAFQTSDPLAIRALVASGLAVTLMPRLLSARQAGVRTLSLAGDAPQRALYALLPDTGATALATALLDALDRVTEATATA